MPKAITPKELVKELKSGKWRKARQQLARGSNQRCCLGVAAELAGAKIKSPSGPNLNKSYVEDGGEYWGSRAPKWASWLTDPIQNELAKANDSSGGFNKAIEILEKL